MDPGLPMHLWCRLLGQAEMTLNMMRESRVHPKISAYNEMHGNLSFNNTSLIPIGIKLLVYEKASIISS